MGLSRNFIIQCVKENQFRVTEDVKRMREKDLCDLCGGELEHKKVNFELHIRKELVICEDLPANVCKQCGEKYFDAEVSLKIDEFIKKYQKEKPSRYIPVPVFSGNLVLK